MRHVAVWRGLAATGTECYGITCARAALKKGAFQKRAPKKLLSENAFNATIQRMGYSGEEVTAHGFRVTASSLLNARGYNPDVIEAALAHQDPNTIRRAYNRATYWDERVTLMQDWADLLDDLKPVTFAG